MATVYDDIGRGYTGKRSADPRIAALIHTQLGESRDILNIGAGTGSYEPVDREVIALEPSKIMIAQRAPDAAPVVQGRVEQLPFPVNSFDLTLGILTLHHWSDWRQGLREAMRVAGGNVVLLTWFDLRQHFWLSDYFPEIDPLHKALFPTVHEMEEVLGEFELIEVPIPHDCSDGFMCAYWRRPEAYLEPEVRNSISLFSMMRDVDKGLRLLESDLASRRWHDHYGALLEQDAFDYGYRLLRSLDQPSASCTRMPVPGERR